MSHFGHLPPADYEKRDVHAGPISRGSIVISVLTVLSILVAWAYFRGLERQAQQARPAPVFAHEPDRQPPGPQLQRNPFDDVVSLRQRESEQLGSYALVDGQPGLARIPIDEAMRIYVERAAAGRAAHPFAAPAPPPAAEARP